VDSVHFFALKMFGTLHGESNNFFRIKKLKYFEAEGFRFMEGLRIGVFKTIKYVTKFRFLAFLEVLYIILRTECLFVKKLLTGGLSSIHLYAPCITPTYYNVMIVK
jgi:hypothetical protein